ncbi:unnamed protein product [Staurois parvus]|nr:unnamed protein product [Staurois parvus]
MVINISFVSKGGRGLRCELVITMCDKLGRNILWCELLINISFVSKGGKGI